MSDKIAQFASDLYDSNPERCVWGSDWPYTPPHPASAQTDPEPATYRDIDPADMLKTISDWFEDPADRERILVSNPDRLYYT